MGEAADPAPASVPAEQPEDPTTGAGPSGLFVWALAAFHTALLVAILVAALYRSGAAGELLGDLDTWIGVAAYLYLWGITWWTNRRWFREVGPAAIRGDPDVRVALLAAAKWGGVTGLLFFGAVFVVLIVLFVATAGIEALPFLALLGAIGLAVSFTAGAVVGTAFALVDLLLLRVAAGLLTAPSGDSPGRTARQG